MRRAVPRIALVALALVLAFSSGKAASITVVNGIGLVDYASRPTITPGMWVKYRVEGGSTSGQKVAYDITVIIAALESFWGEDCFWVETHTEPVDGPPRAVATLMSFSIFDDDQPVQRMKYYMRKSITDFEDNGQPRQDVVRRPSLSMRSRSGPAEDIRWHVDTLGTDTVQTASGLFTCMKVKIEQGLGETADHRDSTVRTESRDIRTQYLNRKIPITHLARENIENRSERKTWKVGRSQDAPWVMLEQSLGVSRLTAYGTGKKSAIFTDAMLKAMQPVTTKQSSSKPKAKPTS
jgi:hypothetical protein